LKIPPDQNDEIKKMKECGLALFRFLILHVSNDFSCHKYAAGKTID